MATSASSGRWRSSLRIGSLGLIPRLHTSSLAPSSFFFFFNDTATTEIYTLSLHDALPIWVIFEDVFLVLSCLRSIREMRAIATRTAALEASEQGFRQIFAEAPIGMGVVSLDESFTQVNATLCQMLGYTEEELKQRTTMDITFEDDIPQGRQNAEELLTGGPRSSVERRYVCKNGGDFLI